MAVRRLYSDQPQSFTFTPENLAWAKETIAKYPPGKEASAVLPVLWRAQEQHEGWLPEPAIRYVADMLGMAYIRVLEVATFYTMFQLAPVGKKAHIQVCGTTPCMLRGAEDLIKVCKSKIHAEPGESIRTARDDAGDVVVQNLSEFKRVFRLGPIAEHDGNGGEDLQGDAALVAIGESLDGVPGVAADFAKQPIADHHFRSAWGMVVEPDEAAVPELGL